MTKLTRFEFEVEGSCQTQSAPRFSFIAVKKRTAARLAGAVQSVARRCERRVSGGGSSAAGARAREKHLLQSLISTRQYSLTAEDSNFELLHRTALCCGVGIGAGARIARGCSRAKHAAAVQRAEEYKMPSRELEAALRAFHDTAAVLSVDTPVSVAPTIDLLRHLGFVHGHALTP